MLGEEGARELPSGLRRHPSYGRLQLMGREGVENVVADLIREDRLREVLLEYNESEYVALRLSQH